MTYYWVLRSQGSPGDFIVKRRDGLFAYQLACAVDEHIDSITDVIRGVDLLESTPMQCFISERLGFASPAMDTFPFSSTAMAANCQNKHLQAL